MFAKKAVEKVRKNRIGIRFCGTLGRIQRKYFLNLKGFLFSSPKQGIGKSPCFVEGMRVSARLQVLYIPIKENEKAYAR